MCSMCWPYEGATKCFFECKICWRGTSPSIVARGKNSGLATTRTFCCFPYSNCIQEANKSFAHITVLLPASTEAQPFSIPSCLKFLGTISSPCLTWVFCAHASEIHWNAEYFIIRTLSFQKLRLSFSKTTLSLTINQKMEWLLFVGHICFACHFPCSFVKPLAVNWKLEIKKGMYCMRKKSKKKEEEHTPN